MKNKIITLFVCLFFLSILFPIAEALNRDIDEGEYKEINRIANSGLRGLEYREFVRGRIDDLHVEGNYISFFAKGVRSIGFASDGSSVFFWRHRFWQMSMSYTGFQFRGILRPRFICGIISGSI